MTTLIKNFWKGNEGATMVEYGLMVALIAAVCIATITTLGTTVDGLFQKIVTALTPSS